MKVLLAAGGSAGHIEPALTLADTLTAEDPRIEVVVVGTDRGIENDLVPPRGYRLETVPATALPRRVNTDLVRAPYRVGVSVRAVSKLLSDEAPDVVVGFGGYVALPAYLAARRRGIPLVVHEANAHAGIANRVGARLTEWVAQAVPGSIKQAATIGMPMRKEIRELAHASPEMRRTMAVAAREHFNLAKQAPTLLVFGGSLGARHINETMEQAQRRFAAQGVQILHITGAQGQGLTSAWPPMRQSNEPAYVSVPYVHDMHRAFAAADLVVCRAGATTCAELSALGIPAIYVPLPIGNGEQVLNAQPLIAAGGGVIVNDADLNATDLVARVIGILADTDGLAQMGSAARTCGVLDADERLADIVRAAATLGRHS
ncbi:MAG: undecaprenyldiphospho-muramoylpentapeptide beta-N-acetylglucosaminyltransferase [Candidatus Nanopelagicales bacterium]